MRLLSTDPECRTISSLLPWHPLARTTAPTNSRRPTKTEREGRVVGSCGARRLVVQRRVLDKRRFRDALARFIVRAKVSHRVVELQKFEEPCKALNPQRAHTLLRSHTSIPQRVHSKFERRRLVDGQRCRRLHRVSTSVQTVGRAALTTEPNPSASMLDLSARTAKSSMHSLLCRSSVMGMPANLLPFQSYTTLNRMESKSAWVCHC